MEPSEILGKDENAAVIPAAKKVPDPLGDVTIIVRSPLLDVSNRSFGDVSLNGSSNLERTVIEVDDSSNCGGKSGNESPASSTPSRLDTTTDDYESADEGPSSPSREVNLSVLASQLETLNLGTPTNPVSDRPRVLFPYSPFQQDSVLLSSPDKYDEACDETIRGSPISVNLSSPVESDGNVSSRNHQLDSVFEIPGAVVDPVVADRSATVIESHGVALERNIVVSPDTVEEDNASNASPYRKPASPEIACKSENPFEETLSHTPETNEIFRESGNVKSPVSDLIAHADKITLREDSPLAASFQEKCYGEGLNVSLAPAQVDVISCDKIIRHSTGFCKKDILLTPIEVVEQSSFPEGLPECGSGTDLESPGRRESGTKYILDVTKSLNEATDLSAKHRIAEEIVDSCIAEATSTYPNHNLSAPNSIENCYESPIASQLKEENREGVCEGYSVENVNTEPTKNIVAVHADSESTVHIGNAHEVDSPGIKPSLEESLDSVPSSAVSNADVSVYPTPETVHQLVVTSMQDSSVDVANSNNCIDEVVAQFTEGAIPIGTEVPKKTEVTVLSELQLESETLALSSSDNASDLDKVDHDAGVTKNTSEEEISVALTTGNTTALTFSCSAEPADSLPLKAVSIEDKSVDTFKTASQSPGLLSQSDSSSCDYLGGLVAQSAKDTKEQFSDNSPSPVGEIHINGTFGDAISTNSLEIANQACQITESEVSASVETGGTEREFASSPKKIGVLQIENSPALHLMGTPEQDSSVDITSSKCGYEDVVAQSVADARRAEMACSFEQTSEKLPSPVGEIHTIDSLGDNKLTNSSELAIQACEIAESGVPATVDTVGAEYELATSPEKMDVLQIENSPASHLLGTPSEQDSRVGITSSKCGYEDVVAQCFADARRANVSNTTGKTEMACSFEQTSEELPSPVGEIHTIDSLGDNKLTNSSELAIQACKIAESEVPATVDTVGAENELATSSEKMDVLQIENSPALPLLGTPSEQDSRVGITSSKCGYEDVVAQCFADARRANVSNTTGKAEMACSFEQTSEKLPSPVGEIHTIDSLGDNKLTNSLEPKIQACEIAESEVPATVDTVGTENEMSTSPKKIDVAQIYNSNEPTSPLHGVPPVESDFAKSSVVDSRKSMLTMGESYIVSKTETGCNRNIESYKCVDFASLSGVQENPKVEQDLKAESMDFYCSPESVADHNTSDDKSGGMGRSYKDLSQLLATCSKQEQELGGRTFDFSCIQAEAAKIACDIIYANDTKTSGLTQPMMQSALSAETNNSEAGPITADEDFNKEEFFHEVTALDFEYLARAGSKQLCPSKLSRQSLYVKFDPLVGKLIASSEDSNNSLITAMADHNQSSGEEAKLDITPPSHSENDERLIPITPATTKKEQRQSAGGHTPSLRQEISKLQELMIQQEQAHQEKADLVEELRSRIAELEATENHRDSGDLEKKYKLKDEELKLVQDELDKARGSNKQLIQVMEEYEKTISQLVTVKEETKAQMEKDKETIAAERDTALQHLSNMEVAFNDIHQKYERAKTVIETLHANEKELKKSYDAVVETVEAQNTAYQKLKQHAAEKLTAANAEIEKIHKEYNGEMARMKAVAKKNELKCKSLEESLEQKKKELREMTQICDELIGKVTGKPYE